MIRYKEIIDFDLVCRFLEENFSSPTHWPEWNLLVSKYFKTEFYYFGAFEGNNLTGICPVHKKKACLTTRLISGQYHFLPNGGWIFSKLSEINLYDIPISYNSVFECFALPFLADFKVNYTQINKKFQTLIIDLRSSEESIWSDSVDSKRRNMIRKANRLGIKVIKRTDNLDHFYSVYADAGRSNNLECLPFDFFTELVEYSKNITFIPFVAYFEDEPCGALGLIHDRNYSFYWLGANKKESSNYGQGELLQWEAILYCKEKGCTYYDLCYIEKERLPNIYEFKKGFSKNEVEIPFIQKKAFGFRVLNRLQIKR